MQFMYAVCSMLHEKFNISVLCDCVEIIISFSPFYFASISQWRLKRLHFIIISIHIPKSNHRTIELESNVESSYRFDCNNNINNEQFPRQRVMKIISSEID